MLPSLGELWGIHFYTYPLMMGLAWGIAYHGGALLFEKLFGRFLWNFFFWGTFLFAWLGAKLLFLITTTETNLLTNSSFWLGGGFVFYGGLLGGLIFVVLLSLFHPSFYWRELGRLVPVLCLAHAVGRLGCFFAGCCYGQYCELIHSNHPVQLYESFSLFVLSFLFYKALKKNFSAQKVLASYFFTYGLLRFCLEFFRGDSIRGYYGIFSTSQWISLILILLAIIIILIKNSGESHDSKNLYESRG